MRDSIERRTVANFSGSQKKNLFPGLRYGITSKSTDAALRFFGFQESEMDRGMEHFRTALKKNTERGASSSIPTVPMREGKDMVTTTGVDSEKC
jgi:hypothetical protein